MVKQSIIVDSLLQGSIVRSLLRLATPIVLANLLQSAYQLVDAFWVGRLGGDAVAAIAISLPINFLAFALGSGFSIVGSTLIAQYMGARNHKMVNHVAGQVLLLALLFSLLLSIIGVYSAPQLLDLLGVNAVIYDNALSFLRISLSGIVFTFGFTMIQSLMRGAGEAKIPLIIVFFSVLLNALLDPPLIFGWGIIPPLGVMGAACATLITQALALIIGLWLLIRGYAGIRLLWRHLKPDWRFIKRALKMGLPASIELSARALGMNVMMFLVTGFGSATIAAYGIVNSFLALAAIPAIGLAMASGTLVGQNIGAEQLLRARAIGRLTGYVAFIALTFFGLIAFIAGPWLISLFVPGEYEVIAIGAHFLRIVAFSFGLIGLQMAYVGVFRAAGKTFLSMCLAVLSQWIVQIPLAWLLSHFLFGNSDGLWWAFPITNIFMAAITLWCYLRLDWQRLSLIRKHSLQTK